MKKWMILLAFFGPACVSAAPPWYNPAPSPDPDPVVTDPVVIEVATQTTIKYSVTDIKLGIATSNAFSALTFDKGSKGLQWSLARGHYDGADAYVGGIGYRFNKVIVNGAYSFGAGPTAYNIGIGGNF